MIQYDYYTSGEKVELKIVRLRNQHIFTYGEVSAFKYQRYDIRLN